ncbi:MAG: prepilin-type N-terminal cleavage/methylation domain-containing protein [Chryseobacterium sp.]
MSVVRLMLKKGFTLIEILITVFLIGIISFVAMLSFDNIKSSTNESRATINLETVVNAERSYYAKYGKFADSLTLQPLGELSYTPNSSESLDQVSILVDENKNLLLAVYGGENKCFYKIVTDILVSDTTSSGTIPVSKPCSSLSL